MDYVDVINTAAAKADLPVSRTSGDGEAFDRALQDARSKATGRRDLVNGVLNKNNLSAGLADGSYSFGRGALSAADVAETLDLARAGLPSSYQKQLGVGLMTMGRSGLAAGSMQNGAALMNCSSSAEALRDIFSSLGAARAHLKLDRGALGDLSQILADSGLNDEEIDGFLSGVAAGNMSIDDIYARLEKLDLKSENQKKGLTATEDGLAALGQFLSGLGASPETVAGVVSGFMAGDQITVADLRHVLNASDDSLLAPCLTESDVYNLASMLKSMGAGQNNLQSLSNMLARNNGQTTVDDVLNFLEGLENTSAKTVTGQELKLVKNILDNITREQELVKLPVFDETLVKLQALGDREIDDDFMRLSPALQALRGGISGSSQNAAFGGQSGQQERNGQQRGQHDARDSKEQARQSVYAANNESTPAAAAEAVETVQSYGGQESLARQISQKIAYSHRRGIHRLKMNLNPVDMGRLDIELKVQGDQLVAHIRAENRETYQALAGEIESLKAALADSGLEISNLTLAFDDQATGRTEFADLRGLKEQQALADDEYESDQIAAAYPGSVSRVI